jgi:hypothetical protein
MNQITRNKILYWLRALDEDVTAAREALLCLRNPDKQLRGLIVPIADAANQYKKLLE